MPMFGLDNIHDKEGKPLSKILEEIRNGLSGGKGADLKDYAKASDVKEVKDMVEGLISDLKAGKYNLTGVPSEDKKTKEIVKEEKIEK
jgi:hypothetical protein